MIKELNTHVDNALVQLIVKLEDSARYDEASLVINRLVTSDALRKALDILGSHLNVSKLKDSTTRKCLASLMPSKISAKQDLDLSLLQRIIDITQNAPEAFDVGNQVYNLLYDAGLVS